VEERLQKVLARAGIASRRAAEALIVAGRVRVDGQVVSELGVKVNTRARIEVDGRIVVAEPLVYIVLHKPRGVVCTLKDPEGRPTVAEYLKDVGTRVVPVGRLDFHTSGALICTNDGELASHLTHPRHHAQKEYVAKVGGIVNEQSLERFRERIMIDGRATQPAEVHLLRVEDGKSWLSVKLGEGRNRQVRRLGEHAGMPVMRLVRVAHAGIDAEGLRPGEWRRLSGDELRALKKEYGFPRRIHPSDARVEAPRGGHLARRKTSADRRDHAPARPVNPGGPDDSPWRAPRASSRGPESEPSRGPRANARGSEAASYRPDPRREQRPAARGDQRRPASPGEQRRAARGDQRRPDARGDQRRPAPRSDERRPAPRGDQRRPAPRSDERRPAARGEQRRPEPRGESRRPLARGDRSPHDTRRAEATRTDARRPVAKAPDRKAPPRADARGSKPRPPRRR
jgi:23S rRNA pseudouridine2605 synthase